MDAYYILDDPNAGYARIWYSWRHDKGWSHYAAYCYSRFLPDTMRNAIDTIRYCVNNGHSPKFGDQSVLVDISQDAYGDFLAMARHLITPGVLVVYGDIWREQCRAQYVRYSQAVKELVKRQRISVQDACFLLPGQLPPSVVHDDDRWLYPAREGWWWGEQII